MQVEIVLGHAIDKALVAARTLRAPGDLDALKRDHLRNKGGDRYLSETCPQGAGVGAKGIRADNEVC